MIGFTFLIWFCLLNGIFAVEKEDFLADINVAIEKYMKCINRGGRFFSATDRFKTFVDPVTKKEYAFEHSVVISKQVPEKMGKATLIEISTNMEETNRQLGDMKYRFNEKVTKSSLKKTGSTTANSGSASLAVGVDAWVVSVEVKTTVSGEIKNTAEKESENSTVQMWNREEVIPGHTKSNTKVEKLIQKMRMPSSTVRTIKGVLPIKVVKSGRDLMNEAVWKRCSDISAPEKISDTLYLVKYENFGDGEMWKPDKHGGLEYKYVGSSVYFDALVMSHTRTLQSTKTELGVEKFCRMLSPDVVPVIPDANEADIEIDDDFEGRLEDTTTKLGLDIKVERKKEEEEEKDKTGNKNKTTTKKPCTKPKCRN